ncbi:MAG: manganese efflux pump MntP family protein [Clostridia bacterium]|nr:manganese efflux pump MntP family protein [Clostridia bacterium]
MGLLELSLIGVSLAMDAFSVSICKGLATKKMSYKNAFLCGLYFGIFQALMPLIGYLLGSTFESLITSFDHWICFILLFIIGLNMIRESFSKEEANDDMSFKTMLLLAIATSIDALAVGVTFSFLNVNIIKAIIIIGAITFVLSFVGVMIGNAFGSKYENKAKLAGGIILILMGVKILLEHLNIIKF